MGDLFTDILDGYSLPGLVARIDRLLSVYWVAGVLKAVLTRVLIGLGGALSGVDTGSQHGPVTGHPEVQSLSVDLGQSLPLRPVKKVVLVHLLTK